MRILRLHDPASPRPHAEVLAAGEPRSTQDGGASFEASLREAPQVEEGGSVQSPAHSRARDSGLYVRVSPLSSGSIDLELRWAMSASAEGIVLPRAVGLADIERLGAKLGVAEAEAGLPDGTTRILAVVGDSPAGAMALSAFRRTPRLAGLAHDPASLATAIGCEQGAPAVTQAAALVVLAAAACGVEAVLVANHEDDETVRAAERAGFGALLVTA